MRETQERTLKNVIDGNKKDDGAPVVFTKEVLKKHLDKAIAAKQRMHDANADWKGALDAAEKAGIPKKEFKDLIKEETKPTSDDYMATMNVMREMLGKQPMFDFGAPAKKH